MPSIGWAVERIQYMLAVNVTVIATWCQRWDLSTHLALKCLFTLPLSITALSAKVPWTTRRSNQLILKEVNPEYSLEGLMLKLKLQYFVHLMQTANSLEKTMMLGKIEGRRRRGSQRMKRPDGITNTMGMNLGKFGEMVRDREAWRAAAHGVTKTKT